MEPVAPSGEDERSEVNTRRVRVQIGPLLAAAVGLLVFVLTNHLTLLNPTNVGWLFNGDFSPHFLGWLFFRNEALGWPLGRISGYIYPLGTTLGFTDSIPWAGLIFRVVSNLLPTHFQYIGPWMGLSAALQGAAGAWIARRFGVATVWQVITGGFLVISPPMFARMSMAHDALSAHWLILIALGLNLVPSPDERDSRWLLLTGLSLCIIAAGVHPVLAVMVLLLVLALCGRVALERRMPWTWPAGVACGAVISVGLLLTSFGYFSGGISLDAGGFGLFSANLNTFINPLSFRDQNFSRMLPALSRWNNSQYEGYGYLGLGGLFALVAAVMTLARQRRFSRGWHMWAPVLSVSVLMFIFALSQWVTLGSSVVLDLSSLYRPFLPHAEMFRSSGRFLWPLYYLLLVGSIGVLLRLERARLGRVLLVIAFVLQTLDVNLEQRHFLVQGNDWIGPPSAPLTEWARNRKTLVVWPPMIIDGSGRGCDMGPRDLQIWAFRAYLLGLRFNSGYVARVNADLTHRYCRWLDDELRAGHLESDTLYLTTDSLHQQLEKQPGVRCVPDKALWLCELERAP